MSSEPSPFQQHLNNNIGTLHHLGALAAYKQAQSANEHARRVEGQNEELAATQAKIASIEEERLQMLKDQQRAENQKQEALKSVRKTLVDAKQALDQLDSAFGLT